MDSFSFFLSFFRIDFLLNIGEQIFSVNSRRWSNGWSYICRSYFRSSYLRLNSLIKDIYIYIYFSNFSRYVRGNLVSFPSKPIAGGEILILINTAPGWIQSVLKQLRTFVSARTKVDHVTRSLPSRMLIHVLFLDIAIKVRRAVSNDAHPSTHAKSRTYAMERRNDNWNLGQISVTCNRRRDYPNVYASNDIRMVSRFHRKLDTIGNRCLYRVDRNYVSIVYIIIYIDWYLIII